MLKILNNFVVVPDGDGLQLGLPGYRVKPSTKARCLAVLCLLQACSKAPAFDLGSFAGSLIQDHKADAAVSMAKAADTAIFVKKKKLDQEKFLDEPHVCGYVNDKLIILQKTVDHPLGVLEVLDLAEPRAWSDVVGGEIFVTKGMLEAIRNEAELLGMLAQPLGNFDLDHSGDKLGLSVADKGHVEAVSGDVTKSEPGTEMMSQQVNGLVEAHNDRDWVVETDRYAADKLLVLGYDPNEYLHLLRRLAKADDESLGAKVSRLKQGSKTFTERAEALAGYLKGKQLPAQPKDPGAKAYQKVMASLGSE